MIPNNTHINIPGVNLDGYYYSDESAVFVSKEIPHDIKAGTEYDIFADQLRLPSYNAMSVVNIAFDDYGMQGNLWWNIGVVGYPPWCSGLVSTALIKNCGFKPFMKIVIPGNCNIRLKVKALDDCVSEQGKIFCNLQVLNLAKGSSR